MKRTVLRLFPKFKWLLRFLAWSAGALALSFVNARITHTNALAQYWFALSFILVASWWPQLETRGRLGAFIGYIVAGAGAMAMSLSLHARQMAAGLTLTLLYYLLPAIGAYIGGFVAELALKADPPLPPTKPKSTTQKKVG